MDKLLKLLAKLHPKEKLIARDLIFRTIHRELFGLNVKKLQGHSDIYRIRRGRIRVIYTNRDGIVEILDVSLRDEKTYKNL